MSERDERREALAEVLVAHRIGYERRAYPAYVCYCGWDGARGDNGGPDDGRHDTWAGAHGHLADALTPLVAGWLAEAKAEALREAADSYLDCLCGHEIDWHHEERGCLYLGNGERRCRCLRDAHTAVSDRLRTCADRIAEEPA